MRRVVHEIRNHLAIAVANVEAFRDGVLDPSPRRLASVLQALGEVELLLRELTPGQMAVDPVLATHPRAIDVYDVIANEVLGFEAATRERAIRLTMEDDAGYAEPCIAFAGDPVRIGEIVNNIVANAVRYTPPGGRIDVAYRRSEEWLVLSVTDDGPGIRSDETERIFEAGYRGSASIGTAGTGAGLALVKRFVEEHGGTIDVANVRGRGACFTVALPAKPCASVRFDADAAAVSA
jgi:two-component system sensor histidine kinase BaeS